MSRWQIELTGQQVFERFRHAVVNAVDTRLDRPDSNDYGNDLERNFAKIHGSPFGPVSNIRRVLYQTQNRRDLAIAIENLLWAVAATPQPYGVITSEVDELAAEISDVLQHHPLIGLRLAKEGGDYELHPAGAAELDATIDEVLAWLRPHAPIREEAVNALRSHVAGEFKEALNSCRVALEMLVRSVTNSNKTLENQIGGETDAAPLLSWVRTKGVKPEVSNLLQKTIKGYCDVQNAWVKHQPPTGSSFDEAEAEYALYTAFTVMKLLLTLARPPV